MKKQKTLNALYYLRDFLNKEGINLVIHKIKRYSNFKKIIRLVKTM